MNKNISKNSGFSLVELVVVIAIMAVLMGILAPTYVGYIEKTRESTDIHNLDVIRGAVVTAMAQENIYTEVMKAAWDNDPLVVDIGESTDISFDTTSLGAYPLLQQELRTLLDTEIEILSAAGKSNGNYILIEVAKDGKVSAYIADDKTKESSDAVRCRKTLGKDDGMMKLLAQ